MLGYPTAFTDCMFSVNRHSRAWNLSTPRSILFLAPFVLALATCPGARVARAQQIRKPSAKGGVAVAIDLRLEESGGRLDRATILLLLDREADEFIARRADVDLMLVKPVDAGILRRAAKQLLPAAG